MKNSKEIKNIKLSEADKISRKEALQKAGFIAFSAASMMLLLNNPAKGQEPGSDELPPDW